MKKKGKKKNHRILKVFLSILLIIILFIGGFVGYSAYKNGWGWKGLLQTVVGQDEEKLKKLEEFRVLILGVSEDISVALTDTIMVASYNPQTQKAVLLSIPRDTFIGDSTLNATSYDKINAVFQKDGAEGTLKHVNRITGLDIENYIVISNNALVELVDEIGGVEFDVPTDMNYDSKKQNLHIHLSKGKQTLNGEQAEGLVRFRKNNNGTTYSHEYGNDDYGRMKTQREFLKVVAKQTLQAKNITKIGNLIDIVKKNVKTNIKDWSTIKDYIPYAIEFDMNNLQAEALPGESSRIPANTGLWFFQHDKNATKELVSEIYTKQNQEDSKEQDSNNQGITTKSNAEDIKIEILNGSERKDILTEVTQKLKNEGYTVYKTGTTSTTSKTTIINKSNISDKAISNIQNILGTGITSSSNTNSSNVDLTIIIGKDY